MGVEYFLTDKKARVAYELGKGAWAGLTCDIVERCVTETFQERFPEYQTEIIADIQAFFEKHPEAAVMSDDCFHDYQEDCYSLEVVGTRYRP